MAEEEGSPELHPGGTVFEEGVVHAEYQCWCLKSGSTLVAEPQFIEVVAVCRIESKLLVAVPLGAWHRTLSRRLLPSKALTKAVTVEVSLCAPYDREATEVEDTVKLWMGFLNPSLEDGLEMIGEETEIGMAFADGEFVGFLPSAYGLVEAAQEHFAFETAASGGRDVAPATPARVSEGDSGLGEEDRLSRLERVMNQLVTKVDAMTSERQAPREEPSGRPSALRRRKDAASSSGDLLQGQYPDLDPSVVAAALNAGVEPHALQEMQRLMQSGQKKQKKLGDPGAPAPGMRVKLPPHHVLSESESDAEPAGRDGDRGEGSGSRSASGGGTPVSEAVTKLTEIMGVLTAEKTKRSKSSVEAALDGVSSSGLTEGGSIGSGKRTAAARRILRTALKESPTEIYQLIERAMLEDLTSQTLVPGVPAPQLCSRAWLEHRSKIGHWKTSAYCAWSAAGALDSLIQGNTAAARARLCLLILMLDQTACDRGSWALSSELALEPGPPMSVLGQHVPPSIADGEQPFSKLLDARWAEVAMSHIRETEEFLTKRQKLGRKDQTEPDAKPKQKPKAKAGDKPGQGQTDH